MTYTLPSYANLIKKSGRAQFSERKIANLMKQVTMAKVSIMSS